MRAGLAVDDGHVVVRKYLRAAVAHVVTVREEARPGHLPIVDLVNEQGASFKGTFVVLRRYYCNVVLNQF